MLELASFQEQCRVEIELEAMLDLASAKSILNRQTVVVYPSLDI